MPNNWFNLYEEIMAQPYDGGTIMHEYGTNEEPRLVEKIIKTDEYFDDEGRLVSKTVEERYVYAVLPDVEYKADYVGNTPRTMLTKKSE